MTVRPRRPAITPARLVLANGARAFTHRNYRLFFSGQLVSLIGTWMQQVAMAWLVYRLTGSALMLGLVNFCARIPIFLASPFLGVLADRWNRHRIILSTQTFSMLQALTLALLVLSHRVQVWHLFVLSLFIGLVNAMDIPARQSFLVEMVDNKEDLGSAIALNSSLVNGARLIGPAVAGILITVVGEGICFLINSLSYLAIIVALLMMRISPRRTEPHPSSILQQFGEGARYAYGFRPTRAILLLVSLVSLMGLPYMVLLPVFRPGYFSPRGARPRLSDRGGRCRLIDRGPLLGRPQECTRSGPHDRQGDDPFWHGSSPFFPSPLFLACLDSAGLFRIRDDSTPGLSQHRSPDHCRG